jgi:hypothetical protein
MTFPTSAGVGIAIAADATCPCQLPQTGIHRPYASGPQHRYGDYAFVLKLLACSRPSSFIYNIDDGERQFARPDSSATLKRRPRLGR